MIIIRYYNNNKFLTIIGNIVKYFELNPIKKCVIFF